MLLSPGTNPQAIIDALGMHPHPEGGWYTELYRAPAADRNRPALSTIHFLLRQGERSHWHTVDAVEVWLWQAGAAVRLDLSSDGTTLKSVMVGPDVERGEVLQAAVEKRPMAIS